jgi:hypothetical protein
MKAKNSKCCPGHQLSRYMVYFHKPKEQDTHTNHSYSTHSKHQKILSVANIVIPKLDNIVPAFYGTRSFTPLFTRTVVPYYSVSSATRIKSRASPYSPLRSILILSSHPSSNLLGGLSKLGSPTKILYKFHISSMRATRLIHLKLLSLPL